MSETDKKSAGLLNAFLRAAKEYKRGLESSVSMEILQGLKEGYQAAQKELEDYLSQQHAESAGFGQQSTPPPAWVGPIRGHMAEIAANLKNLESERRPVMQAVRLQAVPACQ